MSDSPLVLAIDIGTSSVRANLYDLETRPLPDARTRGGYTLQTTPDGGAFLEPDEVGALVAYLCSEDARGLTGEALRISAGSQW